MKKIILLIAAAFMMCGSMMAQRQGRQGMSQEEMAQRRAEQLKQQAERLAKDMDLPKDKREAFVADYTAYQTELQEAMQFDMNAFGQRQEQKKAKDMSDDECFEKITEVLTRQQTQIEQSQKRLEVMKKWVGEFMAKEYTPQQLYQIFAEQRRASGQGGQRMGGGGFPGGGFPGGGAGGFGGGAGGFGGGQGGFGGGF